MAAKTIQAPSLRQLAAMDVEQVPFKVPMPSMRQLRNVGVASLILLVAAVISFGVATVILGVAGAAMFHTEFTTGVHDAFMNPMKTIFFPAVMHAMNFVLGLAKR